MLYRIALYHLQLRRHKFTVGPAEVMELLITAGSFAGLLVLQPLVWLVLLVTLPVYAVAALRYRRLTPEQRVEVINKTVRGA